MVARETFAGQADLLEDDDELRGSMVFNTLDLIVRDVPTAAAFFRDALGLTLRVNEDRFAEIETGAVTIMLSPEAMVPTKPAAGIILHFQVDDVASALARARKRGAEVLMEPTQTGWGWESAMVAGPEDIVIDFYRPIEQQSEHRS